MKTTILMAVLCLALLATAGIPTASAHVGTSDDCNQGVYTPAGNAVVGWNITADGSGTHAHICGRSSSAAAKFSSVTDQFGSD